ncbi:MAG: hypothetical protein OEW75_16680, partial [Cyclobacteriaceae bacterium]|nr:hypothetical protein [Cyclobacteriaceae bacterium]
IVLTLSALLISVLCFSQDITSYKNGTEIKAKVLEITTLEVKFKKFDNLEGPTYTILKSDLFMITYENGSKEIFSAQPNTPVSSPSQAPKPTSYSQYRT